MLNATGATLTSWNQTSSFCSGQSWEVGDGTVSTDSSGVAVLATTGKAGSCGAHQPGRLLVRRDRGVHLPSGTARRAGHRRRLDVGLADQPGDLAVDGEMDAVEAEPVTGVNAASPPA